MPTNSPDCARLARPSLIDRRKAAEKDDHRQSQSVEVTKH